MPAASYLVGRKLGNLAQVISTSAPAADLMFASERIDGTQIAGLTFEHCTFANISFKDCVIERSMFRDCTFVDCYFRGARIQDSDFAASKFIECDFSKIDIRACDFRYYNTFKGCWIPRRELENTLPQEPNLRHHLCINLSAEARAGGDLSDAEWYHQAGRQAMEKHLRGAFMHSSQYYREKFNGSDRAAAFGEYLTSRIRGRLWGYRKSYLVVLRNWAFLTFALFPFLFFLGRSGLARPSGPAKWSDVWTASLGSMLPGTDISSIKTVSGYTQAIAFIEVLIALLFGGLCATLLFRAVFERWR